jgi:hypothetical protein
VYLQGQGQSDEVNHHLFVGQFHADEGQQGVERLKVLWTTALLLTRQVDVAVQLLCMLGNREREESEAGGGGRWREGERESEEVEIVIERASW